MGFSCYSWIVGGFMIEKKYMNPVTGKPYDVVDLIEVYQAELYGLLTFS